MSWTAVRSFDAHRVVVDPADADGTPDVACAPALLALAIANPGTSCAEFAGVAASLELAAAQATTGPNSGSWAAPAGAGWRRRRSGRGSQWRLSDHWRPGQRRATR